MLWLMSAVVLRLPISLQILSHSWYCNSQVYVTPLSDPKWYRYPYNARNPKNIEIVKTFLRKFKILEYFIIYVDII